MSEYNAEPTSLVPWKLYLTITVESLLIFYLATFCMAVFFTQHGASFILLSILMGLLYCFVLFAVTKRILQKLPLQALMLIIPLAPLIALFSVISLIPVLQLLK